MRNFILLFFIILFTKFQLFSQVKSEDIVQKTYQLLEKGKYKELVEYSKNVLDDNIDFFYLRLRLGIAYFKLKDYKMAIYHLEKSLSFNSDDKIAIEYLYYSYLMSGSKEEASKIKEKYKEIIELSDNSKQNFLQSLYFESGISISNNYSKNSDLKFDGGKGIYGESNLNDKTLYTHLGAEISISPSMYIYNGFNLINVDNISYFYINNNYNSYFYNLKQLDYYVNSKFIINNRITFSPALHLINVKTKKFTTLPDNSGKITLISESDKSFNDYVLSSIFAYNYKRFRFQSNLTYSKLNESRQYQIGGELMFFPFGNLDLYTQSALTYLNNNDSLSFLQKRNSLIFNQMIGAKILKKIWTEVGLTIGDIKNYNESNGFVVYNIPDVIKLKTYINILYTITPKIELSLRYQFLKRKDFYQYKQDYSTTKIGIINYQNYTLIGGIKWTF